MANVNDIKNIYLCGTQIKALYLGNDKLWPTGIPVGTVYNFDYTGTVQSVELPPGKYKLQCWGAQGGTSYGNSNGVGSKGGYSEGILTLTETTTLYVFVGGKGSNGSSTSLVNGGWNGGGASVGYSSYSSGDEDGESYPASGGGSTDFCTVTSSMSYSNGRTNRSSASLLSRIIVAGGGGGGSYYRKEVTTTTTTTREEHIADVGVYYRGNTTTSYGDTRLYFYASKGMPTLEVGKTYKLTCSQPCGRLLVCDENIVSQVSINNGGTITISGKNRMNVLVDGYADDLTTDAILEVVELVTESATDTSTSSGYSNKSQQGGGASGKGQYPGTQTSAGSGGGFGYGANQSSTNYRYCSGGSGGGWYGGGTNKSDTSTSYVNYTGGGSGFVNIAANSSYRPSGYTGLQLDSGTTIAGNTSHPSTSGGTETGHSGNGYARITAIGDILGYEMIPYVEFTGNQYVNTGFIPSNTTKLWMDFEIPTPIVGNVYYGSRDTTSSNSFLFAYSSINNKLRTQFGSQVLDYDTTIQGKHEITHDKNVVTLDGVTKTHNAATFKASKPLYLGAENRKGTVYFMSTFRIYGCKIYDNDVLVRDFVPTKNGDGIVGLYDRVTDTFYTSGTGTDLISG